MMEIYAFPNRKEVDRIWRCLEYVFEIPANIPKDQRGRWVMTEVRDKMGIYIASRKVLAPSRMLERIGNQSTRSGNTSSASPPAAVGKVQQGNEGIAYGYAPGATSQHTPGPATLRSDASPLSGPAPQATMPVSAPSIQSDKTIDIDWVCRRVTLRRRKVLTVPVA